jgi:nascent polypeptide-associated complex subunit beta
MTDSSTMAPNELETARLKMIAARFGGVVPTREGGKGISRRKKKVKSKNAASAQSDAKLSSVVNKLGATNIPGIEEVNIFIEDGTVLQFKNPKVQASIAANTYVISGPTTTKTLQELLPSMMSQAGMGGGGNPNNPFTAAGMDENTMMQQMLQIQSQLQSSSSAAGGGALQDAIAEGEEGDDDDDDVPDLVEGNFEEVSEK